MPQDNPIRQRMMGLWEAAQDAWWRYPLLRWMGVNLAGWSVGMFAGSWLLGLVGGVIGVAVGGAAAGVIVGAAQWIVLKDLIGGMERRRWLSLSAAGGLAAALPAALAGFTLVAGTEVGFWVIGALFGGIFGGVQWAALRGSFPNQAAWWIGAHVAGGGMCAWLALGVNPGLPVCCSFGPVAFGLLTGWALRQLRGEPLF